MTPEDYAIADRVADRFDTGYILRGEYGLGVPVLWPPGDVLTRLATVQDERAAVLMSRAQWSRFVPRGGASASRRNAAEVAARPLELHGTGAREWIACGGRLRPEELMRYDRPR